MHSTQKLQEGVLSFLTENELEHNFGDLDFDNENQEFCILIICTHCERVANFFADANDIASIVNDAVGADELAIFQVKTGQKLEIHVSEVVLVGDTDVKPTRILSGKDIN